MHSTQRRGQSLPDGATAVLVLDREAGRSSTSRSLTERWTSNISFDGKDRQTLFITCKHGPVRVRMRVKGANAAK